MTTYYMVDRFTGELVCVFQARSFEEASEVYRRLDPYFVFHISCEGTL